MRGCTCSSSLAAISRLNVVGSTAYAATVAAVAVHSSRRRWSAGEGVAEGADAVVHAKAGSGRGGLRTLKGPRSADVVPGRHYLTQCTRMLDRMSGQVVSVGCLKGDFKTWRKRRLRVSCRFSVLGEHVKPGLRCNVITSANNALCNQFIRENLPLDNRAIARQSSRILKSRSWTLLGINYLEGDGCSASIRYPEDLTGSNNRKPGTPSQATSPANHDDFSMQFSRNLSIAMKRPRSEQLSPTLTPPRATNHLSLQQGSRRRSHFLVSPPADSSATEQLPRSCSSSWSRSNGLQQL